MTWVYAEEMLQLDVCVCVHVWFVCVCVCGSVLLQVDVLGVRDLPLRLPLAALKTLGTPSGILSMWVYVCVCVCVCVCV